jgi:hypothetical protein
MRASFLLSFALLLGVGRPGAAQDFVSASSGVLQYFEGVVVLDDQVVEHKVAVFPSLKNGSTLHTDRGRAELLLTPGVYLRMDESSSLRMTSNSLTDTRVQLTAGTAILDNLAAKPDSPVAIIYDGSEVRFPQPGVYRIDCDLGELQAYSGESKVRHHGASTTVDPSHRYYFALELTTDKTGDGDRDEFYDWAHNRSDMIADQNQTASAEQADRQDADPGAGMFVVPPPLYSSGPNSGVPAPGYSSYASAISPFYLYPQAQYLGYSPFTSVIFLSPYRQRFGGSRWPGSTGPIYHPNPVITRWPITTPGSLTHYPYAPLRYPAGASVARPATTAPHGTSTYAAPHAAAPHLGAVGHR